MSPNCVLCADSRVAWLWDLFLRHQWGLTLKARIFCAHGGCWTRSKVPWRIGHCLPMLPSFTRFCVHFWTMEVIFLFLAFLQDLQCLLHITLVGKGFRTPLLGVRSLDLDKEVAPLDPGFSMFLTAHTYLDGKTLWFIGGAEAAEDSSTLRLFPYYSSNTDDNVFKINKRGSQTMSRS